jgi:predicted NAD/FAD-binding protein
MLTDPTPEEQKGLSPWRYQLNQAVLHTDESVMPPLRGAWASWNYTREKLNSPDPPVSVTYHLNRIQGLKTQRDYFVTLNRQKPIPSEKIIREITYTHPTYTREAVEAQTLLSALNGAKNTYFCGSYTGYGFHEDAVKSGVEVGRCFNLDL